MSAGPSPSERYEEVLALYRAQRKPGPHTLRWTTEEEAVDESLMGPDHIRLVYREGDDNSASFNLLFRGEDHMFFLGTFASPEVARTVRDGLELLSFELDRMQVRARTPVEAK